MFWCLISEVSFWYIEWAFLSVLKEVYTSNTTSMIAMAVSGSNLFRFAPINAPSKVGGSITTMRSQSMSGLSATGCLFLQFKSVFAMLPPKTVTFERGIACFGKKFRIRI